MEEDGDKCIARKCYKRVLIIRHIYILIYFITPHSKCMKDKHFPLLLVSVESLG